MTCQTKCDGITIDCCACTKSQKVQSLENSHHDILYELLDFKKSFSADLYLRASYFDAFEKRQPLMEIDHF